MKGSHWKCAHESTDMCRPTSKPCFFVFFFHFVQQLHGVRTCTTLLFPLGLVKCCFFTDLCIFSPMFLYTMMSNDCILEVNPPPPSYNKHLFSGFGVELTSFLFVFRFHTEGQADRFQEWMSRFFFNPKERGKKQNKKNTCFFTAGIRKDHKRICQNHSVLL